MPCHSVPVATSVSAAALDLTLVTYLQAHPWRRHLQNPTVPPMDTGLLNDPSCVVKEKGGEEGRQDLDGDSTVADGVHQPKSRPVGWKTAGSGDRRKSGYLKNVFGKPVVRSAADGNW